MTNLSSNSSSPESGQVCVVQGIALPWLNLAQIGGKVHLANVILEKLAKTPWEVIVSGTQNAHIRDV